MALETAVLQQDFFIYSTPWINSFHTFQAEENSNNGNLNISTCGSALSSIIWDSKAQNVKSYDTNSLCQEKLPINEGCFIPASANTGRRKRQRNSRSVKNKEEVEHQRMTHITVERNRRKQMNDYLSVLRSIMPSSYVQRGDQASIIGGAINYVKELEQLLQSLESHKRIKKDKPGLSQNDPSTNNSSSSSSLFSNFFSFPQYSAHSNNNIDGNNNNEGSIIKEESEAIKADIEVTMVENHANLKILIRKQPKQLLKMVDGLFSLGLTILHINVTTVHHMVLYSFSLKAEEECKLSSVNEIAAAVYEMIGGIQEEKSVSDFSSKC